MESVDDLLNQMQARLGLEAEDEHEVLEEVRGHLEEAIDAARAKGLDEQKALREAAASFGIEQAARELHRTHSGWGALDGIAAAALPVIFALMLRWLIFAPGGTADRWREILAAPSFALIAVIAIVIPILRFPRWRYALAIWVFFWGLSLITAIWPTLRW